MSEQSRECPRCGASSSGRFCSSCGASLGGVHCTACGAEGEPGGRFCNSCGAPLGAGVGTGAGMAGGATGSGESKLPWMVAGGLLVALILAVALPQLRQAGGPAVPTGSPAGPPMGPGAAGAPAVTDLTQMTPREAADRLYDRVMRAASAGDSTEVSTFLPMAIAAHERAEPLDADGYFHKALLQRMALDAAGALATAREALAVQPNHLLLLAVGGGAAADMGDAEAAADMYRRFLDNYDAEIEKGLEEYEIHGNMLPELRAEAEQYLGG